MIEVEQDGELIALVWFQRVYEEIIELHAVAHPDCRGRWLTREMLSVIERTITKETDCSACLVQIHSHTIGRLWAKMGFDVYPSFAILKVKDFKDGISVRKRADSSNSGADQGSGKAEDDRAGPGPRGRDSGSKKKKDCSRRKVKSK